MKWRHAKLIVRRNISVGIVLKKNLHNFQMCKIRSKPQERETVTRVGVDLVRRFLQFSQHGLFVTNGRRFKNIEVSFVSSDDVDRLPIFIISGKLQKRYPLFGLGVSQRGIAA